MPSPFPGMNPYLEALFLRSEVHNRLILALANDLGRRLRPKYYAAIETRTYLEDDSRWCFSRHSRCGDICRRDNPARGHRRRLAGGNSAGVTAARSPR